MITLLDHVAPFYEADWLPYGGHDEVKASMVRRTGHRLLVSFILALSLSVYLYLVKELFSIPCYPTWFTADECTKGSKYLQFMNVDASDCIRK